MVRPVDQGTDGVDQGDPSPAGRSQHQALQLRLAVGLGDPEREAGLLPALQAAGQFVVAERCLAADEVLAAAQRGQVDVLLVAWDLHRLSSALLGELERSRIPLVLLAPQPDEPQWRRRRGLVLPLDASPDAVLQALQAAVHPAASHPSHVLLDDRRIPADRPDAEPEPRRSTGAPEGAEATFPATLSPIVVSSGPGSPGRTTVALNLAAALGAVAPTVLVEADLEGPSLAAYLDADPTRNLTLLAHAAPETPKEWDSAISRETQPLGARSPHGVVLCGIPKPELRSTVSGRFLTALLAELQARYRYVVVDIGPTMLGPEAEAHRAALTGARQVLLVASADLVGLWRARTALGQLHHHLGLRPEQVGLVINRHDAGSTTTARRWSGRWESPPPQWRRTTIGACSGPRRRSARWCWPDATRQHGRSSISQSGSTRAPSSYRRSRRPCPDGGGGGGSAGSAGLGPGASPAGQRRTQERRVTKVEQRWFPDGASPSSRNGSNGAMTTVPGVDRAAERELREEVRVAVSRMLSDRQLLTPGPEDEARIRALIQERVTAYQRRAVAANTPQLTDPAGVERRLFDGLLRLGILQPLMEAPDVEEILANGPHRIFCIAGGRKRWMRDLAFDDDEELRQLVKRLIGPLGKRLDESSPMVDARLPDGSRLNAAIPPATTRWCCVTIRKFLLRAHSLEQLVHLGTLPEAAAQFLDAAVQAGVNILVSGATGAGKTTLLNALGASIASLDERVVTVEEVAELLLERQLPDCVALQARSGNVEGAGEVRIRELVRNALRMRPTRIIVGEVRGAEALDMLLAMNTGHEGSLTTIHGNSPRDALERLATLGMMAEERLTGDALTRMVARTIELVVQVRLEPRSGRRLVTQIFEVTGLEGGVVVGNDLWVLEPGRDRLVWTGIPPRCAEKMAARGVAYALPAGPAA